MKFHISTRIVVMSAVIAALYVTMTLFLAPIGYAALQFRTACVLYGLIIFDPIFVFGLALGVFFANLASPFGPFDYVIMPFVTLFGGLLTWYLRKKPFLATCLFATIISAGVAFFPLGLGARLPFLPTFLGIWITQLIIVPGGWLLIWKPLRKVFVNILKTNY